MNLQVRMAVKPEIFVKKTKKMMTKTLNISHTHTSQSLEKG